MRAWSIAVVLTLLSVQVYAQEQMAVRLNEKGIMKLLQFAVQYNASQKGSRTVVIPQNIYKFTIPKAKLLSNPIIPVVNEISDLNMSRDLDFYFNTSEIKITGRADEKSLKSQIFNSNDNGFDVKLSINLPSIVVNGARLSLCEDKAKNSKACGSGLKATLNQVKINTTGKPVTLSITLRLKTDGKVARVSVRSVDSNLEGKSAPGLNINFQSIDIPRIAIVINGQETELDTSRLKDEILKRKQFLAQKLLSFAGDFIANDLAEMINVYLVNKEVMTSYLIWRKDNRVTFDEFLSEHQFPMQNMKQQVPQDDIMKRINELIKSAQVGISLKKIATPGDKDIELAGLASIMLNGRVMQVNNTLRNSNEPLPKLDLSAQRNNDINLVVSEPLINGALDVANSTKLFQDVFESISPVKGFMIKSVKLHFWNEKQLIAVVNAQVDLKKLESKGIGSWFKNKIAAWLERNNNNSVIYFPIEVIIVPDFKKLSNGGTSIDLKVMSPFNYVELKNRFNYPTNVPAMTETVKDGVMDELKESIEPYTNKTYSIDVSKFLNQSGFVFQPKSISINQGAYLLMNLDLVDIKFNAKNPNQR